MLLGFVNYPYHLFIVSVTFPQPFSHLLDVHVIIGDSSKLYKMVAGLEAEVGQSERQSWDKLTWLTKDW